MRPSCAVLDLVEVDTHHISDFRPCRLPNDLGRHPVRRTLHRTKDVTSTHAEILKKNHTPSRSEVRFFSTCFIAHPFSVSDTLTTLILTSDRERRGYLISI